MPRARSSRSHRSRTCSPDLAGTDFQRLPWNHTFGGNHNFGLVLAMGGTLHVDDGKVTEDGIRLTARNLLEVRPTAYFNVPRGYELLLPLLQQDGALCEAFFGRLQFIESAAAALPAATGEALRTLARRTTGRSIPLVNGWGATETAPVMTMTPLSEHVSGSIGVPVAGAELKLLPLDRAEGGQYEVRVRGPNVFPGYWGRPELSVEVFDEEGFYRMGDIVRCVDPAAPERGLAFAGRRAEEFKLPPGPGCRRPRSGLRCWRRCGRSPRTPPSRERTATNSWPSCFRNGRRAAGSPVSGPTCLLRKWLGIQRCWRRSRRPSLAPAGMRREAPPGSAAWCCSCGRPPSTRGKSPRRAR